MRKVGGPVQRIHIPPELPLHPLPGSFFSIHSVLWIHFAQTRPDQLLHRPVRHRHQVHIALVLGGNTLGEKLSQSRARFPCDLRGLRRPAHFQIARGSRLGHEFAFGPVESGDSATLFRGIRLFPASVIVSIWCL